MRTQIISIGNELLIGDTVNTNGAWLANWLHESGFVVTRILTIPDDKQSIQETVRQAMSEAPIVFCTGGLGPTHDDITKTAVAELFNSTLVLNQEVLAFVEERLSKMNITLSKSNREQAMLPDRCEVLFNNNGTAPGMWFHENGSYLVVLPGVPSEMKSLMQEKVKPKMREVFGGMDILQSQYIQTVGIGESNLSDDVLGNISSFLNEDVSLAYLPFAGGVCLRLNSTGESKEEAEKNARPLYTHIYEKAQEFIIGEGRDFHISEAVGELLRQKKLTIATAESCSGGLIAHNITNVSGSAEYMMGGIVAYENQVKIDHLFVDKDILAQLGAVSKEVALQMAKGVAKTFKTEIGISTTGIAGPTGGSPEKPVGTVWLGFYAEDAHFAIRANFTGSRLNIKQRSMIVALDVVRRYLLQIEAMPYQLKKHFG